MKRLITPLVYCSLLLVGIGFSPLVRAQAHLWIAEVRTCPGSEITVAVMAENLVNLGAITLKIGYDTNVMVYKGHMNVNPQFPGLMSNAVFSPAMQVNVAWSSLTGGNLASGKLMDLKFKFKNDSCDLTFNDGCELADVMSQIVAFTSDSGQVALLAPYITAQPVNKITTEGEDVSFTVGVSGADLHQWQHSENGVWSDLVEGLTFQNVATNQLTVSNPSLSLDNSWYRCFLSAVAGCQQFTDSVRLTVLPEMTGMLLLPDTAFCPETNVNIPMTCYALDEVSEFEISLTYDPLVVDFQGLTNINPLLEGITTSVYTTPFPMIMIKWTGSSVVNLPDGVLFELNFDYHDGMSLLVFLDESYVSNALSFNYNLLRQNGSVSANPVPTIYSQPQNVSVMAGQTAQFITTAFGVSAYQWYVSENQGATWDFITSTAPYSGAQSSRLVVAPTPLEFDGFLYRCYIANQLCSIVTNEVQLSVDTNTAVPQVLNHPITVTLNGWCQDDRSIILEVLTRSTGELHLELFDVMGRTVWTTDQQLGQNEKRIFVVPAQKLAGGVVLCRLVFRNGDQREEIVRKILMK